VSRPLRAFGFLLGLVLCAWPAAGQQAPQVKAEEGELALGYLLGRYRMPVTCTLADGSIVQREEAIVIRRAASPSRRQSVRATFFGVDAPGALRCYNVVNGALPDRRGSLTLGYEGLKREDLGMHDLRLELKRGALDYVVVEGRLEVRPFGEGAEPRTVLFRPGDGTFSLRPIPPASDGNRLLAPLIAESAGADRRPRQFEFQIQSSEGFAFSGFYLEDVGRAR
jgi:hypothetical protein